MPDDSELLLRYARHGDQTAFRELVDRHLGKVYAVALRKTGGNAHLAQEAAQTVFTDLARKARPLSRHKVLSGWLFLSARYAASNLTRSERRRQLLAMRAGPEIASNAQPEPSWDAVRPEIDDAIHELGTSDREALLLRFFEGRNFSDMGRRLSISEDGARLRVERALAKLRRKLERRGIQSTAAVLAGTLATQVSLASMSAQASAIASTAMLSAASPAFGVATFAAMTTSTKLGIAIVAIGLLAAAFKANSAYRSVEAERDEARAELNAAKHQNATLLAKLNAASNAANQSKSSTGRGSLQKADSPRTYTWVHTGQILKDNPEAIPAHERMLRRGTMLRYSQAIAALQLDPGTASRLKDLLMQRDLAENQAGMNAYYQGIDPDSKAAEDARNAARDEVTTQIKGLIGDDGLAQLDKLAVVSQAQGQFNQIVSDCAADMDVTGAPLTPGQNQALKEALAAAYDYRIGDYFAPSASGTEDPSTHLTSQDNDLIAAITTTLNPAQIETLKQSLADKNDYQRMFLSRVSSKGGMSVLAY